MLKKWSLLQYVAQASGRAAIDEWRRSLPVGGPRTDLDEFLKLMVKCESWGWPDLRPLRGKRFHGLTELRWKSSGKPHRILGFKSGDFEYTMLIGCTHNQQKYDPTDALETARRRKIEIDNREATCRGFEIITDRRIER